MDTSKAKWGGSSGSSGDFLISYAFIQNDPDHFGAVYMTRLILVLYLMLAACPALAKAEWGRDDWELQVTYLKHQIEQHARQHPSGNLKDYMPYVKALQVFAADRDEALRLAQEAQASKDPAIRKLFDPFMDLMERAQDEGNAVLGQADFLFRTVDQFGPISHGTLLMRAQHEGQIIYDEAGRLQFDQDITRQQMKRMLDTALIDLDTGWSLRCDSRYCGWLYPDPQRIYVAPQADMWLRRQEMIRERARYFKLPDVLNRATELMNLYLKDALCRLDKGHQWYLDLAIQYDLGSARQYIEGFYATLYGKVERETPEGRKPADNARVVVTDPHDNRTWQGFADESGRYEIKKVILHKACSPFRANAEHRGEKEQSSYHGPLKEPNPAERFEKNFLISQDFWEAEITYTQHGTMKRAGAEAHRDLQLTIKARLKPRRKEEQPAARKDLMLKQLEEIRRRLASGKYSGAVSRELEAEARRAMEKATSGAEALGRLHLYASEGAEVTLTDTFRRKDTGPLPIVEEWQWSSQKTGLVGFNIGLRTDTNKGQYRVETGTADAEGHPQEEVIASYNYRATRESKPADPEQDFRCAGTRPVDAIPGWAAMFVKVPKGLLTYKQGQQVLNGSHKWTTISSDLADVGYDAFGPECKEDYPFTDGWGGRFQFQHELKWNITRVRR